MRIIGSTTATVPCLGCGKHRHPPPSWRHCGQEHLGRDRHAAGTPDDTVDVRGRTRLTRRRHEVYKAENEANAELA
jgi:hypothetical protein